MTTKGLKVTITLLGIIVLAALGFMFLNAGIILANDDDDDDKYEQRYKDDDDDDDDKRKKKKAPAPVIRPATPQDQQQSLPTANQVPKTEIIKRIISVPSDYSKINDTDTDGVADAFDAHPGEDDFAYLIEDKDADGLADDLEFLKINR